MDGRMNKDVKIGLAIGLLGLIAVFALFALKFRSKPMDSAKSDAGTVASSTEMEMPSAIKGGGTEPDDRAGFSIQGHDSSAIAQGGGVTGLTADAAKPSDLAVVNMKAGVDSRKGINAETQQLVNQLGPPAGPGPMAGKAGGTTTGVGAMLVDSPKTYTVQSGDSLAAISTKVYGKAKYFTKIKEANGITDEKRLKIGQVLNIPALTDAEKGTAAAATSSVTAETGTAGTGGKRTHTVASGETLSDISIKYFGTARQYKVIMAANNMKDERLKAGQVLVIPEGTPVAAAGGTDAVAPKAGEQSYTVQGGDTPSLLSKKFYGTTKYYQAILDANGIKDARGLRQGQKITIPVRPGTTATTGVASAPAATGAATTGAGEKPYIVKPGDSLDLIAAHFYGTSRLKDVIMKRNNLTTDAVKAGDVLVIPPAPSGTGTSAALGETLSTH